MDPGEHAERKKPEENKENEHSVEVSAQLICPIFTPLFYGSHKTMAFGKQVIYYGNDFIICSTSQD